ncbi:hypothetical protein C6I20_16400 [Aeromicrobium sp. A1-2]|uniref:hypothetical protein n=1 Tax=Aeromicrobium sp. A1-2 TaxID=2107713 RepID=UPI000E469E63|nr:hypothetical protein [Aeromicrobium sp. A1-2]AXT86591.1 hypothetical protein C6I20_16400 [Aeromicrobium sp. A1-2]
MRPTNPLWYLAAFVVALGSVMIGTVVAASAWDPVREVTVSPTTTRADAADGSVAVFTDIVQPDRSVGCRATTPGKKKVPVPDAALDITVDNDGNQWHLVGLLSDGSNGLKIQCSPEDKRVDNATYGFAVVSGFQSRANTGNGIGVLGVAVGAVFAGYIFYSRRQSRKERTP